jgi:hypothetical protein
MDPNWYYCQGAGAPAPHCCPGRMGPGYGYPGVAVPQPIPYPVPYPVPYSYGHDPCGMMIWPLVSAGAAVATGLAAAAFFSPWCL